MIIENNVILSNSINYLTLNISEIRYAILDSAWRREHARESINRLYYVLDGSGVVEYGGKSITMLPGNIYLLPSGLDCGYHCDEHLEKLYMHVNVLRYDNYDLLSDIHEVLVFPDRMEEIEEMIRQWRRADYYSMMYIRSHAYQLVCEAMERVGVDSWKNEAYSLLVKRCIEYVDKHLKSGLSAAEIATELFVSDSRLRKVFRQEVGVPIGKYINDRVLSAAELQLRYSDRSVKSISESLGFCDQFYFSRMFARQYGMSPVSYRKLAQG
ncbi:MAG: helix-turn-helix domain-containing protein [Clostridia bacterium]|nr:helix-turn-helix domain-containing protein [Clostridia bacterium]